MRDFLHPSRPVLGSTQPTVQWVPSYSRPGRGVNHPSPFSAEVKERVKLYLYSPSVPEWQVIGWTLPFTYYLTHVYSFCLGFPSRHRTFVHLSVSRLRPIVLCGLLHKFHLLKLEDDFISMLLYEHVFLTWNWLVRRLHSCTTDFSCTSSCKRQQQYIWERHVYLLNFFQCLKLLWLFIL